MRLRQIVFYFEAVGNDGEWIIQLVETNGTRCVNLKFPFLE